MIQTRCSSAEVENEFYSVYTMTGPQEKISALIEQGLGVRSVPAAEHILEVFFQLFLA